MQPFTLHEGLVAPLDRANVDTDAIIPKQFLKSIKRSGFGPNLFDEWRYLDRGEPGMDNAQRPRNPDFVLNQPRYAGRVDPARAAQLRLRQLARARALGARGLRLPRADRARRTRTSSSTTASRTACCRSCCPRAPSTASSPTSRRSPASGWSIDLAAQTVATTDRAVVVPFDVDPFRKHCLLNGLDDIGLTLQHADAIRAFEAKRLAEQPWLV